MYMKSLTRIINAVYNKPWMVLPSTHVSIQEQLEAVLEGKLQMPIDDMPIEPDDMPESGSATAVIPISGIIGKHLSLLETQCGGYDLNTLVEDVNAAIEDPSIKQIVLFVNSPGGSVTGTPEAASFIAEKDKEKPIYCFTDSLMASAAYYIGSQCRGIYCTPSSNIGSVGVYMLLLDESRALDNEGIKVNAISNTDSPYKMAGASFKPLTDEERAMFQKDVDKISKNFKAAVSSTRNIKAEDMEGQVFDGEEATKRGYADGLVNSLDELLTMLEG